MEDGLSSTPGPDYWEMPRVDRPTEVELDIVLREGETPEDGARAVAAGIPVTWTKVESGNCWPGFLFKGDADSITRLKQRYEQLGRERPYLKGKPPVRKGERRI